MWATCLSTPLLSLWPIVSDYIIYQIFMKCSVGVCYKRCYFRVSLVPTGSVTALPYSVSTQTFNLYWLLRVKFCVGDLHKKLQRNIAMRTLMFNLGCTHVKKCVAVLVNKCKVDVFAQQITGSQSPSYKCCHYDNPLLKKGISWSNNINNNHGLQPCGK
jgi:hypothetical protein